MIEIVINDDYGGFGLSTQAMKRLIELGCVAVKVRIISDFTGGRDLMEFERIKDVGDGYEAGIINDVLYKDGNVYTFNDDARTDPNLIQVVKELGEKANADYASLKVIEIPDDVEWTIKEYDGSEWVAEKHRTWS